MSWACAFCLKPLRRNACITATCGHGFHEPCAVNLAPTGLCDLRCPECDAVPEEGNDSRPWRTFWATSDASVLCESQPPDASPSHSAADVEAPWITPEPPEEFPLSLPPAGWRQVAKLERQCEELSRAADAGAQTLAHEQKQYVRFQQRETGLRRDMGALKAQLDCCRMRSLRSVVMHGASQCLSLIHI